MLIRAELYWDGKLLQYSAPHFVRMAPAPPPQTDAHELDIVVFSSAVWYAMDFRAVSAVVGFLGLRAYFVDYEHVAVAQTDALWAAQRDKKVTVVWAPTSPLTGTNTNGSLPAYLSSGGGLLLGANSDFHPSDDCKSVQRVEGRRAIHAPADFSLLSVKDQLSVSATNVDGPAAAIFVMNLLTTFTTLQKLTFLDDRRGDVCKKVIGHEKIGTYEALMAPTCCGLGGPALKVTRTGDMPYTVRDCLLVALKVDLTVDIHAYEINGDISKCFALKTLTDFARERVLGGGSGKEALATEIAAIAHASNIVDPKLFETMLSSKTNKGWLEQVRHLLV